MVEEGERTGRLFCLRPRSKSILFKRKEVSSEKNSGISSLTSAGLVKTLLNELEMEEKVRSGSSNFPGDARITGVTSEEAWARLTSL